MSGSSWPRNSQIRFPILLLVAAAYLWRLADAPIYLAPDEAIISNDIYSLAATGRTLHGDLLPLFVYIPLSASWFMPLIYYWSAPFLLALPFAEWSVRLPTALIAVLSVVLMDLLARRLFRERRMALFAVLALAAAPALFMLGRYALDYIYPIPFILAWLLLLTIALERQSATYFAAAGAALGVGMFSYIASIVLMPVYLVLSLVVLAAKKRPRRDLLATVSGFAVPLTVLLIWLAGHPEVLQGTADRYALRSLDVAGITGRYVQFFNPDFLFLTGDTYLPFSTRTSGVFALALAAPMAAGIYAVMASRHPIGVLVLTGFLAAPAAAAVLEDPGAIRRATGMLPFGALLAAFGAQYLWSISRIPALRGVGFAIGALSAFSGVAYLAWIAVSQQRLTPRGLQAAALGATLLAMAVLANRVRHGALIVSTLMAAVAVQFVLFQAEYHGPYRVRAAPWLQGNIRGAVTRLMAEGRRAGDAPIVFATLRSGIGHWDLKNRWLPAYWQFYLTRNAEQDLAHRTRFLAPADDLLQVAPGSLVLGNAEDPMLKRLLEHGATRVAEIPEVDRDPFFTIVRR